MSEQHDKFLKRLDGSRVAVFRVGEWLHRKGFTVTIPSISYAPDASQHMDHVDEGDIFITKNGQEKVGRVEVKHIDTDFDCRGNWPYKVMFVSNKDAVDRADPEPFFYIIVNKEMTHGGIIYFKTKDQWTVKTGKANNTGNIETNYAIDPDLVKFVDLRA
jgi:hypothetical protein